MRAHVTVSGRIVRYPDPDKKLAAFLTRMQKLADDPKATEEQMIALAYSKANPLLDQSVFPEKGRITKETLAHPVYAVITDLLLRKSIAASRVDVDKLAARYTLKTADAAKRAGVHVSAVRQAIMARRLPAWMKKGVYYLAPEDIGILGKARRGPKPRTRRRRAKG